jgi:hypothetical protein
MKDAILAVPGVPGGVDADDLNWDAISRKVPVSVLEFLCMTYPSLGHQIRPEDADVFMDLQEMAWVTIDEKCREFRGRTGKGEDEFYPDRSLYLETQIAGFHSGERSTKIEMMGVNQLMMYVRNAQGVFMQGELPNSIQPAKIYAAHDVATVFEVRG